MCEDLSDIVYDRYIEQEILIQPPIPETETPENLPTIHSISPTTTIRQIIETSSPDVVEAGDENYEGGIDHYFLLFLTVFGIGLILVVIGIRQQ